MENLYSVLRIGGNASGAGSRIVWTKDQTTYVIENYNQYHNTKDLAKKFNVSTDAIRRLLKKNNVKLLTVQELGKIKRPRNSSFFEKIDTKEKAYWLGFLYADGYNNEKENLIRINLQKEDEEHLKKFIKALSGENFEIHYQTKVENKKEYYTAYIEVCDKKLSEDLAKHGCFQNKSLTLKFPTDLRTDLYSHFIRGYFDGDGSLYYSNRKNSETKYFTLHILGTLNMATNIRNILNKNNLALEKKSDTLYSFNLCGNKQVLEIMKYLYLDATQDIWLNRKRNKFEILLLQQRK